MWPLVNSIHCVVHVTYCPDRGPTFSQKLSKLLVVHVWAVSIEVSTHLHLESNTSEVVVGVTTG